MSNANTSAVIQYSTYCGYDFKLKMNSQELSKEQRQLCRELLHVSEQAIALMREDRNESSLFEITKEPNHVKFIERLSEIYTIDKDLLRDKFFAKPPKIDEFI